MYSAIKHLHIAFVVISITGFVARGLLSFAGSPLPDRSWLRWAPHVNDSLLFAAAIVLAISSGQYPFVEPWLTAKVFGLVAYIALGSVALKAGRGRGIRVVAWLAAILVFGYIVSVALTRNPWGCFGGH